MTRPVNTLTVDAFEALDALRRVRAVIDLKCTLDVLTCVMITASETGIEMTGTDLDSELSISVSALDGGGDWTAAVNAAWLAKILAGSKRGEPVSFATTDDGQFLTECGGVEFSLPCGDASKFPRLAFNAASYVELPEAFGPALAFTARGMAPESTRCYLNGVCLYDDGAECGLVATDGVRMFGQSLPAIEPGTLALPTRRNSDQPQAIIPRRIVPSIVAMLDNGQLTGTFECDISQERIRIRCGAVTMITKLVDGTFPDWRRVVPQVGSDTFGFQATREAVEGPVKRAMKVSSPKSAALALTVNGSVRVDVRDPEGASASAELEFSDKWGDDRIGLRASMVLDFMPAIGEEVRFACSGASNPALITYPGDADRFGVMMPLRV